MTGRVSYDALTISHLSPEESEELGNNVLLVFLCLLPFLVAGLLLHVLGDLILRVYGK